MITALLKLAPKKINDAIDPELKPIIKLIIKRLGLNHFLRFELAAAFLKPINDLMN